MNFIKSRKGRPVLVMALVLLVMLACTAFVFADGEGEAANGLYATAWALLPPFVAIVLALITKEVFSSLFLGMLVGALLHTGFSPIATVDTIINDGMVAAIADSAGIFLFLVLLGILVSLVNASGASRAFGQWAQRNIKSKVGAALATFALGVLIFIDDYFNCLTVGSVMKPVGDSHKMSRAKLAYIIDATAAPICMIAPISSWAAAVSGVASDLNVNGIELFINAIPYNFYSLLNFVFVIGLTLMKFDFGPMKAAERLAETTGDLGAIEEELEFDAGNKGKVIDLLLPVVVLIIFCVLGMIYVGGFFGVDAWGGTDCAGDFIGAFGNTDAYIALPWGALITLLLTVIYMVARRVVTFKQAMECVPKGFMAMVPAITILTMAVSLKTMTGFLGADVFVEGLMKGAAEGLFNLLPAVIFIVACVLAFATGTSWGTFGILIPIVLPIFTNDPELLIIGISACLAGAVCGDHCSPISDTTIMASAGAQCNHVQHVSTQLPYAITVAVISFVTYVFAGFVQNAVISLAFGAVVTIGTLVVLRKLSSKEKAAA